MNVENGGLTLQEASIDCRVRQTADTLKTGDHSFPRIEAYSGKSSIS